MSMNLRHAAALALVGWYLMLAPWEGERIANPDAALSEWKINYSFDSAADCEAMRIAKEDFGWQILIRKDASSAERATADIFLYQKCVATDDPRLSGN
jgi:hypothetical protein